MTAILDTSDAEVRIELACQGESLVVAGEKQTYSIAQTKRFGEALFIDGSLQSTKADEYIYHEMLVHTLLAGLRCRDRILILGGAEGCTLREVLKWHDVNHVTQVDWDKELVNHFQNDESWNGGAYKDSRVNLVFQDAVEWLKKANKEMFDAVIIDLCDPSDKESMELLVKCAELAKDCLTSGGGFSLNCGDCTLPSTHETLEKLKPLFKGSQFQRMAGHVFVPSFFSEWCLVFAVPKLWSNILNETCIPRGMRRFSLMEVHRFVLWPQDAHSALADFWKGRVEKLEAEVAPGEEAVYSQYGC